LEPGQQFEQEHSGCVGDDLSDISEYHNTESCSSQFGKTRNVFDERSLKITSVKLRLWTLSSVQYRYITVQKMYSASQSIMLCNCQHRRFAISYYYHLFRYKAATTYNTLHTQTKYKR